ncbi:MAG: class I SAM-dependent methyltransferase [Solirubrobacteraceae bacterium]
MANESAEAERIRAAYRARDASVATAYTWADRAYRFYMQDLEWAILSALDRAGTPVTGSDILEVGCGSGYFLHRLREYGAARATGLDLMDRRIEDARIRYPTLEFVVGDAAALPWPDLSFDLVTQFTCLSSILDQDMRRAVAAEMWRVCRPGGAILSYDMRTTPRLIRAMGAVHAGRVGGDAGVTPTKPIDVDDLRALFPAGRLTHRVVSLNLDLGRYLVRARPVAIAAAALPFLRSHVMAVVQRPA